MDLICEERLSDSPLVERVWRTRGEEAGSFISMAESHCGMVVTHYKGKTMLTVRGPETRATPAYCPPDAEFIGIAFKTGVFMRGFPASAIMDRRDANLLEASSKSFWLNSAAWQFPDYENADTFVDWLARDDLLVHDPLVDAVLQGRPIGMSLRTMQRRVLKATGLTQGTVSQIERARHALTLLKQGVSILDTVVQAGYADQPHLTRSLKHFIGQTPAQIMDKDRSERLSFLFKTMPSVLEYAFSVESTQQEAYGREKNNRVGISVGGRRHGSAGTMAFPLLE